MSSQFVLAIGNPNSDEKATYGAAVDGVPAVHKTSLEGNDWIDGGRFGGEVRGGWDWYLINGQMRSFELDGPAQVLVDGRDVSASDVAGLGYAGPNPPAGYDGPGSDAWDPTSGKKAKGDSGDSEAREIPESTVPVTDATGREVANEVPRFGRVSRPYSTQGDVEIHVHRDGKFDSLQAAFNVIPNHINHEVEIHVHGRTRDTNTAHIHNVMMANDVDFHVIGHDNAVINAGGVNIDITAKLDHIQFANLEFEMISQCVDARFQNCVFGHNGRACFSGKTGGKMLVNCEYKPGATYCVESIGNEMVEIRGGTLRAEQAAIHAIGASVHVLTDGVDIDAPKKMAGGARDVFVGGERAN